MDIDAHVKAVQEHGVALGDAAERAGLDAAVPTCPDWRVRDLVGHQGMVHRWATSYVAGALTDFKAGTLAEAPDDDHLLDWYREGHAALVDALTSASPDLECWSFLPAPSPLAFWARRQAHETTIHRVDAEAAAGATMAVDPELAVDGIDELLLGFYARKAKGQLVADPPVTIGVRVVDAGAHDMWTVVIGPEGRQASRGEAGGDCVVSGTASEVYQFLWNRRDRDAVDIDGDAAVLDLWREKARVTWS